MVARFAAPKLQRELIEALIPVADGSWTLSFVGDGPELSGCEGFGRAVLDERVSFLGHRDDVAEILARSDLSVLWSRYEGMPISLLESMRAGLCCLASDLPGVRELFGQPSCGVIAATNHELAERIRQLTRPENAEMVNAFGAAARRRFEGSFSAVAMETSTREVYEVALARRRDGR